MSDQALAWRIGFGALVLAFCAVAGLLRKPASTPPANVSAAAAPAPVSPAARAASDAGAPAQPAPLDVQEDAPTRVEITVEDPPPHQPGPSRRVSKFARHAIAPARPTHVVAAPRLHPVAEHRRYASSKQRRPHYPFIPAQRWASRELP